MSESALPQDLVVWPRDARAPAVPGRAPLCRHQPLGGLAGFDWHLRHGLARRREEAFLAAAVVGRAPTDRATPVPGDLSLAVVREAFAASQAAAGEGAGGVTLTQVLGLLRGAYLVLPASKRLPAVTLAAAVAARCGLCVHLACAEKESVPLALDALQAALGEAAPATALAEALTDRALVAAVASGVLVGTASAFAHAWLRWGGEQGALERAATFLSGATAPAFSFAPLLLTADGDQILLDMVRHPLQLTSDRPEDASLFMLQLAVLLEGWSAEHEFTGDGLTDSGEAALQEAGLSRGGLWAVPSLRRAYMVALLRARACVPEQDFVMEGGRLRWLVDPQSRLKDKAELPALELALRCLQGQPPVQRVCRRAWLTDFFAGYARIGASGENLAAEARDLWWLHGLPVLGNGPRPVRVEWSPYTLAALAADPEVLVALGSRRLAGLPGLPPEAPCLDSREGQRALADVINAGGRVAVLGVVVATRQLPAGVSSIILAVDDPAVPPWVAAFARRLLVLGGPGRALARALGAWVLARAGAEREALRQTLVLRGQQEHRTYAFTGEAREA